VKRRINTTPILPVINALDYVHELRRLISFFYNTDETLIKDKIKNIMLKTS
jgi:hypothetical protein